MNRCAKRSPIPWTLNFGCAKSLQLATVNETPMKAKKQDSERTSFDAVVGGHRRVGRPRTRWKDHVIEALTLLGLTNWREALRPAETR